MRRAVSSGRWQPFLWRAEDEEGRRGRVPLTSQLALLGTQLSTRLTQGKKALWFDLMGFYITLLYTNDYKTELNCELNESTLNMERFNLSTLFYCLLINKTSASLHKHRLMMCGHFFNYKSNNKFSSYVPMGNS